MEIPRQLKDIEQKNSTIRTMINFQVIAEIVGGIGGSFIP